MKIYIHNQLLKRIINKNWKRALLTVCFLCFFTNHSWAQWQTSGSDIHFSSGRVGVGTSAPSYTFDVNGNTRLASGWLWVTDNYAQFDNRVGINKPPYGPNRIGNNDFQVSGSIDINGSYGFVNSDKTSNWRLYPSGTDPLLILNMKTFRTPYAVVKVAGQAVSDPSIDESEATLALYRGSIDERNSEFIDLYNNGYSGSRQHGIRIQKRGTGEYRPFVIDFSDGNTSSMAIKINPDLNSEFGGNIAINGIAEAEEILVSETVGADFVFEEDYPLPDLTELEAFLQSKKHLPEIPSAEEMKKKGVRLGDLQVKLLRKIEELTLYMIDQNKKNEQQQELIQQQQEEIDQLKRQYQTKFKND